MSRDAANKALGLFDELFPLPSAGWFTNFQGTKIIKLFPCPFRGVGALLRLARASTEDYGLSASSEHLYRVSNLVRWPNSGAKLLGY